MFPIMAHKIKRSVFFSNNLSDYQTSVFVNERKIKT